MSNEQNSAAATDWRKCEVCGFPWDANDSMASGSHSCVVHLQGLLETEKRVHQTAHEAAERCAGERDRALAVIRRAGIEMEKVRQAINMAGAVLTGFVPVDEPTPAAQLLRLIDEARVTIVESDELWRLWELPGMTYRGTPGTWSGRERELEACLTGNGIACVNSSSVSDEAQRLFSHDKCSRLLSRLCDDAPERVKRMRTPGGTTYVISSPERAAERSEGDGA